MAIPTERTERKRKEETFEQKLARLKATPEERARILASSPPFNYEAWMREAGPAMPEELAEMEEFLREREEERLRSLAGDRRGPVSLGCGTLTLIALIVLIFSGRPESDSQGIKNEIERLQS